MNAKERVERALAGMPVDRIPWSAWYHFGCQHLGGGAAAQIMYRFFEYYRPDFLKVMNDYPYPMPDGLDEFRRPADLARLGPLEPTSGGYGDQLRVLDALSRRIGGRAHFIDTIFDPWTILRKLIARVRLLRWMHDAPGEVHRALGTIARNQAGYARAAIAAGASGIYYSAGAASPETLSRADYAAFCRPCDLTILEAVRGRAPFHVLHLHGENVFFDDLLDYPVHAVHWAGHRGRPSLRAGRRATSGCLIGGVDEETTTSVTPADVRDQVRAAVRALGPTATMIGPGCALPTNTPVRNITAIPAALEELAGKG